MGLTFLHNYYTVFDPERMRIGITESILAQDLAQQIKIKTIEATQVMVETGISQRGDLPMSAIIIIEVCFCILASFMLYKCVYPNKSRLEFEDDQLSQPLLR